MGAARSLCTSLPCADRARILPCERCCFRFGERDGFGFGERDRPGRTIRRPAEWSGDRSRRSTPASHRDNKRLWPEASILVLTFGLFWACKRAWAQPNLRQPKFLICSETM